VERGTAAAVSEVVFDESKFSPWVGNVLEKQVGRAEKGQRKERVCNLESLL
jgi:hypothetical protein